MLTRLHNILVGYDGFDRNESVPALAVALTEEHGATLHLVNVVPDPPPKPWKLEGVTTAELYQALLDSRAERLEHLLEAPRRRGIKARAAVLSGAPHAAIIRKAVAVDADLVIVSDEPTDGRGRRGFGTVTTKLLRECPCPVLAKRDHRKYKHTRVLVAVDVSAADGAMQALNRHIVEVGASLAKRASSQLIVFHAWALWGEQLLRTRGRMDEAELRAFLDATRVEREQRVAELLAGCPTDGIDVVTDIRKGDARAVLPHVVDERKVDLVVMGTVCRTGLQSLLIGNTAERLLNSLTCSVVAVKPTGFVSPVACD